MVRSRADALVSSGATFPPSVARSSRKIESSKAHDPERVVVVDSTVLEEQLASSNLEVVAWPGDTADEAPRVALVDARKETNGGGENRVVEVRRRWPLVDVLVIAPRASGAEVRAFLRAGVKDVLVENDSTDAIERAVDAILDDQRILPVVDELARSRVRTSRFEGMLSRSQAMWEVFETCARVAPSDANVLIFGETGTGKELLARAIHKRSGRSGRFVAVNCSSLPEALVESELFGHERGAFTGAARARRGIFAAADGGTVFLDEIGDMSPSAQQSLLRTLETRTIRPVGGTEEIPVDVRIVAATHVDLDDAVAANSFREDLFYRLDVIRLIVPPLRDRPEDAVFLFAHFLKRFARQYGVEAPRIQSQALERLSAYPWPGNVREVENFAERVTLRRRRNLAVKDVEEWIRPAGIANDGQAIDSPDEGATSRSEAARSRLDTRQTLAAAVEPIVAELEREYLRAVLSDCRGVIQDVADRSGLSRRTVQRRMKALGLRKEDFRGS